MQALFYDGALHLRPDLPLPEKSPDEALIKVLMAGICRTDIELTRGYLNFHGILGHEFVGLVEASDNPFLIGKRVVGEINCTCGICAFCMQGIVTHCAQRTVLGISGRDGVFAEYVTLPEKNLHPVPDTLSHEQAVFVEPLAACFRILEQLQFNKEHTVLVIGDGKLGLLCAQVLKTTGCQLTIVGKHPAKLSRIQDLDIQVRTVHDDIGEMFDIVVDCTGSPQGLPFAMNLIKPQGTIILKTTAASHEPFDLTPLVINEVQLLGSRCGPFAPAIRALRKDTISVRPLISKVFPFAQALEAFNFASRKEALKVLLKMEE